MSCQPRRVTPGQSNSGHKQITFLNSSHICQVNLPNQSLHKHETYIHKHQTIKNFLKLVPSILPVKRAHKARTCWYRRPFPVICQYQVKEKYKKGMDRHNIFARALLVCWQKGVQFLCVDVLGTALTVC